MRLSRCCLAPVGFNKQNFQEFRNICSNKNLLQILVLQLSFQSWKVSNHRHNLLHIYQNTMKFVMQMIYIFILFILALKRISTKHYIPLLRKYCHYGHQWQFHAKCQTSPLMRTPVPSKINFPVERIQHSRSINF